MPITDPVERVRLFQAGYDPDELEPIEDSATAQPSVTEQQQPSKEPEVGRIRSVLANAIASIPSAGAALAAGSAAGSALAPAAAIPLVGPAIPIVGGIGAALLAGAGTRKVQDSAIENLAPTSVADAYKNEIANTQTAHPYYSALGEILGSGPFMRPSAGVLKSAARAITNPLRGNPASLADKGNLLNTAIGAAAPVAANVAQNGTEVFNDPKRLALEILGGAVMNQPTKLGGRLGIHSQPIEKPIPSPEQFTDSPGVKPAVTEQISDRKIAGLLQDRNEFTSSPKTKPQITQQIGDRNIAGLLQERNGPLDTPYENPRASETRTPSLTDISQQLQSSPVREEYIRAKAEKEAAEIKLAEETRRLQEQTKELQALTQTPGLPERAPVELQPKVTETPVASIEPNPADPLYTPPRTEPQRLRAQEKTNPPEYRNPEASPNDMMWQDTETPTPSRTQASADFFKEELGPKRNIRVENTRRVFKPTGEEVKGSAEIKQRIARINPNKATFDTDAHELFHVFYDDLKNSSHARDKALVNRAQRVIKASEDYKAWAKERGVKDSSVDEYLTTRTGEDSVRRLLNTDNTGNIKNWFRDFWAYQKTKFNKASDADFARVMSNRLINDPAHSEQFGGPKVSVVNPEDKKKLTTSDETKQTPNQAFSEGASKLPVSSSDTSGSTAPARDILGPVSKVFKSEVEKVRANSNPKGRKLADAFDNFYDTYNRLKGHLGGTTNKKIREAGDYGIADHLKGDNETLQSVARKMFLARDGKNPTFTAKEQKVREQAQALFKTVRDEIRKRPSLPNKPEGSDDPNYIPHITKLKVIEAIRSNKDSAESQRLQKDFIKYQRDKLINEGADFEKATKTAQDNLKKLLDGYSKKRNNIAENYGPIDKAEGLGLPESWREHNLQTIINRYSDRVARRLAYEDTIKVHPEVLDAMESLAGDKSVEKIKSDIEGNTSRDEKFTQGVFGIVRAANLGTLTGAKDFISGFAQGMQHQQNPIQTVRTGIKALGNLSKYIADAVDTGRIRENINALEWNEATGAMRRIQDILSDAQGRNFLEKVTRGTTMGIGELTTIEFHGQLKKGNASQAAKDWFKNFGKDVDIKASKLSPEDVKKIAARFVDSAQGTYDYRGLPDFAMHGQWSPLFSLARWNIEKANNYNKYVLNPLLKGNPKPFLMSTLGMLVGGEAINKLVEELTGRKEKTPEIKELTEAAANGQNIALPVLYKVLGLASLSGYAGILTDIAKSSMDRLYAKVKPRWYNNMLVDTIDNFQENVANYLEAVNTDGITEENTTMFVNSILMDNLQGARLIFNHIGDKKEEIEKSNKIRDLRSFRLLHGEKVSDLSDADFSKKFINADARKFKRESDPLKAAEMVPNLLSEALEKSKDKEGNINPDRLKEQLTTIKRNSYQTMPNPKTMTPQFIKYLDFLEKTQGKAAADKRLEDYLERNAINQAKSQMIP